MKRRIALLLSICLILMCVPVTASASVGGACGENVTWSFNESTGVLTISGTGEMYLAPSAWGWDDYADSITSVVVSSGVTGIGSYAFAYLPELASVSLPSTLVCIYEGAFEGCEKLTSVTLPQGLTTLYEYAFYGCTGLTGITLPKSLANLGVMCFAGCTNLKAFKVASGNATFSADSYGVLFNKDKTALYMAPGALSGSYSIPSGVLAVASYAFYECGKITSVYIPSSVVAINYLAFAYCESLQKFKVSSSNKEYCHDSNGLLYESGYKTLYMIPGGKTGMVDIPDTTAYIAPYAALGCLYITGVSLPEQLYSIGEYAFAYCASLQNVEFPPLASFTMQSYAFAYCISLKELSVPNRTILQSDYAFTGCISLERVDVQDSSPAYVGKGTFKDCISLTEFTTVGDLSGIGPYAFANCISLESFDLEDVLIVEEYAFAGCINLKEVKRGYPGHLTINQYAFAGCSDLTMRIDAKYNKFEENAFYGSNVTIHYPANGNYKWDNSGYGNFGGAVTWVPYRVVCEEPHVFQAWDSIGSGCDYHAARCDICNALNTWDHTLDNGSTYVVFDEEGVIIESVEILIPSYQAGKSVIRTVTAALPIAKDTQSAPLIDIFVPAGATLTLNIPVAGDAANAAVYRVNSDGSYSLLPSTVTAKDTLQVVLTERCKLVVVKAEPQKPKNPFTDVKSDRFEEPILWAYYGGITAGTGDGTTFSPEAPCTRKQIVTFLWRAAGCPEPQSTVNPFTDVKADRFEEPILWAYYEGITAGTGDGTTFSPEETCTRKQIVTFLWRAAGCPEPQSTVNPFTDVKADRFEEPILWAYYEGITAGTGDGTTFSPEAPCTRKQIVTFLYRDMVE